MGKIVNEDFWPPRPSPYRINFAKNRKKSESTQNGLKRREIEKKILPLGDPPPRKNLEKFSKNFFENFLKVVENHLKREKKNSIYSVITEKNLEKFSNFFFENFSKVVQNHLKREKKLIFFIFFSYNLKKLRKIFKFFF